MKRLVLVLAAFLAALAIVAGLLFRWAQDAVVAQERAEVAFFANELLDRMENELIVFVQQEESRPSSHYMPPRQGQSISPIAGIPEQPFVVGYMVNHPDGNYSTPLASDLIVGEQQAREILSSLDKSNAALNTKSEREGMLLASTRVLRKPPRSRSRSELAERYLAQEAIDRALGKAEFLPDEARDEVGEAGPSDRSDSARLEPIRCLFLDDDLIFLHRPIASPEGVQRQGVILSAKRLQLHMLEQHFATQPMAAFTRLVLTAQRDGTPVGEVAAGSPDAMAGTVLSMGRTFGRPFDFLTADLIADTAPRSAGRTTLRALVAAFVIVALLGGTALARAVHTHGALARRKTQFVSSVTHELKTPLTAIGLYLEMLEMDMVPDHETRTRYLRILRSETSRLSRLIHNVLEFSRLETRNRRLFMQRGDIVEALIAVESVMGEQVRQAGFSLRLEAPKYLEATFDYEAVVQILINLVDNSVKFGTDAPSKEITLFAATEGDRVHFGVRDSGPGFAAGTLHSVFDDFYRGSDPTTLRTKGTGIGLALVRRLAVAMGGRAGARNNSGSGCTVTVTLPQRFDELATRPRDI